MNRLERNLQEYFKTQAAIAEPRISKQRARAVLLGTIVFACFLALVPWQQTSVGHGFITRLDPNDRVQEINAVVSGRLTRWFVKDGDRVEKDDPLVEISDVDPQLVHRLQKEVDAKRSNVEVAKIAADSAKRNFSRQEELFNLGLSSRKAYEDATIQYKKWLSEVASYEAELAKAQISLSRQETRIIRAPGAGTVLNVISGTNSALVKEGAKLAVFLPDSERLAAEVFVPGIDLPLVYPGRKVRLQFEGWPAIQFSGWPSIAKGTFGGKVWAVDPSTMKDGKYRVLIVPDEEDAWPSQQFLRQGTRAFGWILLDEVKSGYEVWRRINGLPMSFESAMDRVEKSK